jgi:leucyl aminopeptidase
MSLVKISLAQGSAAQLGVDVLAVAVTTDDVAKGALKSPVLKALDAELDGLLTTLAKEQEFEGKASNELVVHTHHKITASRVVLLGVGKKDKLDRDSARQAASRVVKAAERAKAQTAALLFPFGTDAALLEAAAEGAQLGAYKFEKYLSEKKPRTFKELRLVIDGAGTREQKAAIQLGSEIGDAVNFARDLVNEPSNAITPTALAAAAKGVATEGRLKAEILEKRDILKLKMGMFAGVAQGSAEPPKLIHIWWEPAGAKGKKPAQKPLAFIGKAITFDSGGLSLKTAQGMETMKSDMAGSAAVFGAMKVVAKLRPSFAVHAFVGACENMPSGTAQRPGDIVRARNGKTVEILNTDAEGRLVLGDVLTWAAEHQPAAMVDLATLTGAIITALGPYTTGLFSPNDELSEELLNAAKGAGEEMWRLPMPENMKELLKSPVADFKNIGGPKGGSITAALFLKEFTNDVPWAHLDIAGSSYMDKEKGYEPRGGTGAGVRTLVELVRRRMTA